MLFEPLPLDGAFGLAPWNFSCALFSAFALLLPASILSASMRNDVRIKSACPEVISLSSRKLLQEFWVELVAELLELELLPEGRAGSDDEGAKVSSICVAFPICTLKTPPLGDVIALILISEPVNH